MGYLDLLCILSCGSPKLTFCGWLSRPVYARRTPNIASVCLDYLNLFLLLRFSFSNYGSYLFMTLIIYMFCLNYINIFLLVRFSLL